MLPRMVPTSYARILVKDVVGVSWLSRTIQFSYTQIEFPKGPGISGYGNCQVIYE